MIGHILQHCTLVFLDTDVVSAVAWSPDCQLMSCADDKVLCKWGPDGDMLGKITSLTAYATSISWLPAVGKQVIFVYDLFCNIFITNYFR